MKLPNTAKERFYRMKIVLIKPPKFLKKMLTFFIRDKK